MRKREETFEDELYDKMWKTRGSRFNAYERLRTTQKLSFYTTSLLSAYLIVINLLVPFNLLPTKFNFQSVSFISVSLSIILLIFVILENSMEYNLKAENFHNCSREIGRLLNELLSLIDKGEKDKTKYYSLAQKYADILAKFDNHSQIDFDLHKAKYTKDFELNWLERQWIILKASYIIHIKYLFFIFGPPASVVLWFIFK